MNIYKLLHDSEVDLIADYFEEKVSFFIFSLLLYEIENRWIKVIDN